MAAPREFGRDVGALWVEGRCQGCGTGRRAVSPHTQSWSSWTVTHLLALLVGGTGRTLGVPGVQAGPLHVSLSHLCLVQQLFEAFQGCELPQLLHQLQRVQVAPLDVRAAPEQRTTLGSRGMPKPTCSTTTTSANPSQGCCRCPQRQDGRMQTSSVSPQHSPYPLPGRPRHPPCPVRHSGPCPESSSVPDPVSLGQSGGSRPCCLAPLCVSSQPDYCPWANILIEGTKQARAPSIPYSPSCVLPQAGEFGAQQRFWGLSTILGAGRGVGSWRSAWDLGTQEKGFSHCLQMLCSLHPSLGSWGPASSLAQLFFLRQKGHTKKPITQPSAPKRGRKSPELVRALGRNTA